jgi:hypothetical protein
LQGLRLGGESQLRTCSNRKCKKGPGGKPNTFIRPYRRGSGFFCDGRCNAAEKREREKDRVAKLEALAAQAQGAVFPREPTSTTRKLGGRPEGLAPETRDDAIALLKFMAEFQQRNGTKNGALRYACKKVYGSTVGDQKAFQRANKTLTRYRKANRLAANLQLAS